MTFHKTLWALTPTEFQEHSFSTQDFIEVLRQASKVRWEAKTELYLFNPATFSMPEGQAEGYRRQVNFVQSSMSRVVAGEELNRMYDEWERGEGKILINNAIQAVASGSTHS